MNTMSTLVEDRLQSAIALLPIKHPRLINTLLIIALLFSAFVILYLKDLNRRLFIQYQSLHVTYDKLYEDGEKLLLEYSACSNQARIQKIAQCRLGMTIPSPMQVIILRLHN
jgi:cell division protein FtsL